MSREEITYGIDLGTSCSAIAVVRDGRPRILEVDGELLVPSVVCFAEGGEALVGRAALNQVLLEPERSVRSSKRWMGSEKVYEFDGRSITPRDVAAMILAHLADSVAEAEGGRPRRVVITVPAWFTQEQRADTRAAAELAGLEAVRLVNEPTAAALAHAHREDVERRALVYDFGGGTFDASLVQQHGALVEVRASRGDTFLGGDDVDRALMERALERMAFEDSSLAAAVRDSVGARMRLSLAVREAKHELSRAVRADVRVPFLLELDGKSRHHEGHLDREDVNRVVEPLIQRTIDCIEEVLADAEVRADQVDELILVGGSTHIPRVWDALHEAFGWEGSAAVPVEQAVALGAAVQGALLDGGRIEGALVDVAPFSLSVAATNPVDDLEYFLCSVVTPRNTPLPSRHSKVFLTNHPFQERVDIPVFQGSDPNPLRNRILGRIQLEGLPPAPQGSLCRPLAVRFEHDLDGMVAIQVADELSGLSSEVRLAMDGSEVAELREGLRREIEEGELVPGDGADEDPYLENEDGSEAVVELLPVPATGGPIGSDTEEARHAFLSILGGGKGARTDLGEAADELRELARQGVEALDQEAQERAIEIYDQLTDRMFALGVYL